MRQLAVALLICTLFRSGYTKFLIGALNLPAAITSFANTAQNPFPYDPGFPIKAVASLAETLPTHSWEYGAASEALLELYNPALSVFSSTTFSITSFAPTDVAKIKTLEYAGTNILIGVGADALSKGDGAVGDPASLGVAAILLGKVGGDQYTKYKDAANGTIDYLLNQAPRFWNGAISQRVDVAELWADWMYMVPPFLAYHAADTSDISLLKESVKQCGSYRQILKSTTSGLWTHIAGPQSHDVGLWATGNGWAAAGMTRVLATIIHSPLAADTENVAWKTTATSSLTAWIKEIVDGAIASPMDNGLLRNYLDNTWDTHGFGEISGSCLIASVVYRMAVLQPDTFNASYISWADSIRGNMASHVTAEGIATPAVNPLAWTDTNPWTSGSPEGQAFVVLMYSGWRDCILARICDKPADSTNSTKRGADLRMHNRRMHDH
ncbi:hypothetical protein K435DRAFT_869944 [Dendrothele bispora CBS 962.96]|uniref:Six-hairpin glycosidase n=1 Tax=Dendrothele bispora (strain CBS 962.96) TaxID=1314807 RepID=A0A4S8L7U0_DENBC|nr:hypothetical protein K435DRAFT_869944 [Dendrothele bispora CBS 962.96]